MARDDRLSHSPFAGLKEAVKKARREARQAEEAVAVVPAVVVPAAVVPAVERSDATLFAAEMAAVEPMNRGDVVSRRKQQAAGVPSPDEEALAELDALVAGQTAFELHWDDEHIEGIATGVDRQLLRALRKGSYSYQGHLDLHGKTREEAHLMVRQLVHDCRRQDWRCVLIVHGRGLNSEGQIPVLKDALARWLTRGAIGRRVLAFCSALPTDGGLGAVYVLLRK